MNPHFKCEKCALSNPFTAIVALVGALVAICGTGGHAIAGAILAVGLEIVVVLDKQHAHSQPGEGPR